MQQLLGRARDVQRYGIISVLFETPSGFAIFIMPGGDLKRPDAMKDIWSYFGFPDMVEKFVSMCEFREFKHKPSAINDTGLSFELAELIMRWFRPGQKVAVGKPEYKGIIERTLGIPCLFDEIVMEVMWGLQNLMHFLVPQEKLNFRNEDRILMSQGPKMLLNRYGFDVKPEMVNARIIRMACILVNCEFIYEKHSKPLRMAGANLKDLSGINSEDWDLMKLATALKIICYPAGCFAKTRPPSFFWENPPLPRPCGVRPPPSLLPSFPLSLSPALLPVADAGASTAGPRGAFSLKLPAPHRRGSLPAHPPPAFLPSFPSLSLVLPPPTPHRLSPLSSSLLAPPPPTL